MTDEMDDLDLFCLFLFDLPYREAFWADKLFNLLLSFPESFFYIEVLLNWVMLNC